MKKIWSKFQQAIFDFIRKGKGNAIVEAVAGSGKTTTIVEAFKMVDGTAIFLAFNKDIAKELESRGVNAKTFHSMCFMPVMKAKPGRKMEQYKLKTIFRETWPTQKDDEMYYSFVTKLVGLGKQDGLDCLKPNSQENWLSIVEHHGMELDNDDASMDVALAMAAKLLDLSNNHPTMFDYDDMLYLCVREGLSLPKFRFIFVDEAQDTNAIQRAILKKLFKKDAKGSRMVAVGDPAQAIYGFRGADSESLNNLATEFQCVRLPLSISYRCPQNVVKHAQRWVSHIQASPDAAIGEVRNLAHAWTPDVFGPQDMVVCRTTKPLIALGYQLLVAKKPFYIKGRDIGKGLTSLVEKQKAKNIETLCERLTAWKDREVEKAIAKDDESKSQAITDKYDALMTLISNLPENARTVAELKRVIDSMFADDKSNATSLCTIHKSKGLEAKNVYWLNSSMCPAPWASGWQFKQEENLCYVATTRAQETLILIEEKVGEK